MYHKILVALENSRTDEAILAHIEPLARLMGSELLLVHVADGWVARNLKQLNLAEPRETRDDRAYLERVRTRFVEGGIPAQAVLLTGEPRKAFQRPMADGIKILNTIQDVYLDQSITIA